MQSLIQSRIWLERSGSAWKQRKVLQLPLWSTSCSPWDEVLGKCSKTHFYVTIPQLYVFHTQLLEHSLIALSLAYMHDRQRCSNQSFFILQTWVDSTSNSKNWLTCVTVGRLGYNKTVGWKLWANGFWSSVCPHSYPLTKKNNHSARIKQKKEEKKTGPKESLLIHSPNSVLWFKAVNEFHQ